MDNKAWVDIIGYEGQYEINRLGIVRGKPRIVWIRGNKTFLKGRIIKTNERKYIRLGLSKNDCTKSFLLHRLIAIAFIPNPEKKRCINHKNGIKTDNRVENLEWVNHSENTKHAFKINLISHKGIKNANSKLTERQVLEIRKAKGFQKDIGKKYGVAQSVIWGIRSKKTWTHLMGIILFCISLQGFAQMDSVVVLPIKIARYAEADLRLKDHLDTLTRILDQENGMLRRQVANRDSVILFDKVEARAIAGLCLTAEDSIRGLYVGEKKRRRVNALWRDVFMLTTFFAMWIAIKP